MSDDALETGGTVDEARQVSQHTAADSLTLRG
jgi:hypothetical protein